MTCLITPPSAFLRQSPTPTPTPPLSPNSLHLLPISLWQHCSPEDNRAWISGDITLKRWLSPSVRKGEYWGVCARPCVCVQNWLDVEGGGERQARIREPSESWLGADTTPPHQGLNLLRDQTHLRWARIIISSIGQFLYYSHPSTQEIWTLVKHLLGPVSCFSPVFSLFAAITCSTIMLVCLLHLKNLTVISALLFLRCGHSHCANLGTI